MPKLLSKKTIASMAITGVAIGVFYLSSALRSNNIVIVNSSNSAIARDRFNRATLVSPEGYRAPQRFPSVTARKSSWGSTYVWDRETEPSYSGITEMTVYRSPSCGCCGDWIEHAKKHGFQIKDIKTEEMEALKQKYNIPTELVSCHTSIIDGYVMEGHIPADDIKRFITGKPDMIGLAVPEMPIGTPGMETRDLKQPFQVLAFNNKGEVEVFKKYQSY